jgi:hypothetical protein
MDEWILQLKKSNKIFTSMYFLALSQAPPVLDAEMAICNQHNNHSEEIYKLINKYIVDWLY